jgi:dipeptidyl aminopeptidase/acylaminoacyl peptidase
MLTLLLAAQFGLQTEVLETRTRAIIHGCSFVGAAGARIDCVLVEPRPAKRNTAGIVFQHGGGQSMMNYISEALLLADSGVVSLIIDPPGRGRPNDMQKMNGSEMRDWMFEVAAAGSRAIDVLLDRCAVDPARIGFVGHSYGANAAAIVSARDRRPSVYVLTGGTDRFSEHVRTSAIPFWKSYRQRDNWASQLPVIAEADAANFLPELKARAVLVQCAQFDAPDLMKSCPAVHELLRKNKRIEWYPIDHSFADTKAGLDRVEFLRRNLKR